MLGFVSEIRDEIRKAIKASDKTRYRLSKETGIVQSQLSRLMSGEKGVSLDNLERLADALDLEIVIRPKQAQKSAMRKAAKHGKRGQ